MGFHTFDVERADQLEDATRYRFLSREELVGALAPAGDDVVADLGSGTGFYTDEVAPHVGRLYAVDVQTAMHDRYREKGLPGNVDPVTSDIETLPFETDQLDGAFSTMTYHEFATADALAEVGRAVAPGGRLVVVDWSAAGAGESGPPAGERFAPEEAATALRDAGFEVVDRRVRPETFVVVARSG